MRMEADHWEQALAVELWGVKLGELEPIRGPLLVSARQLPVRSIASGLSRVSLAFGQAAEAADALDEADDPCARGRELRERLWELGAVCIAARACLAALGSEDEPLRAASAARALLVEMRDGARSERLLECRVNVGPSLIAHIGGFVGPLAVGATLMREAAIDELIADESTNGGGRQFESGVRLAARGVQGLRDHAVDAALSLARRELGVDAWWARRAG